MELWWVDCTFLARWVSDKSGRLADISSRNHLMKEFRHGLSSISSSTNGSPTAEEGPLVEGCSEDMSEVSDELDVADLSEVSVRPGNFMDAPFATLSLLRDKDTRDSQEHFETDGSFAVPAAGPWFSTCCCCISTKLLDAMEPLRPHTPHKSEGEQRRECSPGPDEANGRDAETACVDL